jgi:hypothetical protein
MPISESGYIASGKAIRGGRVSLSHMHLYESLSCDGDGEVDSSSSTTTFRYVSLLGNLLQISGFPSSVRKANDSTGALGIGKDSQAPFIPNARGGVLYYVYWVVAILLKIRLWALASVRNLVSNLELTRTLRPEADNGQVLYRYVCSLLSK